MKIYLVFAFTTGHSFYIAAFNNEEDANSFCKEFNDNPTESYCVLEETLRD